MDGSKLVFKNAFIFTEIEFKNWKNLQNHWSFVRSRLCDILQAFVAIYSITELLIVRFYAVNHSSLYDSKDCFLRELGKE